MKSLPNLTFHRRAPRLPHMLNDECLSGLCWGDLEAAWLEMASAPNRELVPDFITALWKESAFLPEAFNLRRILTATVLLAGPDCSPGLREGPASET